MDESVRRSIRKFKSEPSPTNLLRMWQLKDRFGALSRSDEDNIDLAARLGNETAIKMLGKAPIQKDKSEVLENIPTDDLKNLSIRCAESAYPLYRSIIKENDGNRKNVDNLIKLLREWQERRLKRIKISDNFKRKVKHSSEEIWHESHSHQNAIFTYSGMSIYAAGKIIYTKKENLARVANNAMSGLVIALKKSNYKKYKDLEAEDILIDFLIRMTV